MTSQRGDSGMAKTPNAKKTQGTAPMPSMSRHPKLVGELRERIVGHVAQQYPYIDKDLVYIHTNQISENIINS